MDGGPEGGVSRFDRRALSLLLAGMESSRNSRSRLGGARFRALPRPAHLHSASSILARFGGLRTLRSRGRGAEREDPGGGRKSPCALAESLAISVPASPRESPLKSWPLCRPARTTRLRGS